MWDVIADGWTYSMGGGANTRMRAVDCYSARARHAAFSPHDRVWPVAVNDETEVESCRRCKELVLLSEDQAIRIGPESCCGSATPNTDRAYQEMAGYPSAGRSNWIPRRLVLLAVYPRNRGMHRTAGALAERRTEPE